MPRIVWCTAASRPIDGVPRGRKRAGWKAALLEAVENVAGDLPPFSEQEVLKTIKQYRRESRVHLAITPAPKA